MKKIFAVAGAVALASSLAACGGDAEEPAATDQQEEVDVALPEIGTMVTPGTYTEMDTVSEADAAIVDLNGDGTYTMVANGQEQSGTWEENDRGVCMTSGETEDCYTITEDAEEGVRTITGDDGQSIRYSYEAN